MPGDAIVADNGQATAGFATTVILTWLAAERRRRGAWWVLVFSAWSLAVSAIAIAVNPGGAIAVFAAGSAAAVACVLSRPVREHVDP